MRNLSYAKQWNRRLRSWLLHRVCSQLYRDNDTDLRKSVIVAGTARSGTTWIAQLIGSQYPARVMFEPFHSGLVPDYSGFNYFQYMRPEDDNDELYAYCHRVFSGAIRHPWIDRVVDTLNPEMRIIKEIRANLFLKWIQRRFPDVPLLFVIRHPCAVVQSRMQLDWATDGDITPFLAQPTLLEDHLGDRLDLLSSLETPQQKHAAIWSISNLVPLRQFSPGEMAVVFYEDLCVEPEMEVRRVFETIGKEYQSSIFGMLERPSSTAKTSSAVMQGGDRVVGWQSRLTSHQVEDILSVVSAFGLDYLYGDSAMPLVDGHDACRGPLLEAAHE